MSGVMVQQKKQGMAGQILPVAGTAIGTAFGGPVGGMIGGAIGNKLGEQKPGPGGVQSEASAMQRRMPEAAPAPEADLAAAQEALAQAPAPIQQQYGPALAEAQKRAMMNRMG